MWSKRAKKAVSVANTVVRDIDIGGTLVLDNFSPPAFLPAALHAGDPERDRLFAHPRLLCAEIPVSRRECVMVATRTG